MRLEMDIGNTRVKWRLVTKEHKNPSIAQALNELDLPRLPIEHVWISSVASDEINEQVNDWINTLYSVDPVFARVDVVSSSMRCAYHQPEQLGVDRWLAMLASRHQFDGPLMVVDAGSAITIDLVDGDEHRGGFITPGFTMLQTSLLGQTAKIRFEGAYEIDEPLGGADTAGCVWSGAQLMFEGLAQSLLSLRDRFDPSALIVLTGGDAQRVLGSLSGIADVVYQSDLVLDGLQLNQQGVI